jgi:polynucleotide 5'-kinase involved in rRNA processing
VALVALALGGAGVAAWRLHEAASVSPAAEVAPGLRPTPARSFYNRERELQYVQAKLSAEPTSVTLIVGPENSGKTGEQQRYRVELNLLSRTLQCLNARS